MRAFRLPHRVFGRIGVKPAQFAPPTEHASPLVNDRLDLTDRDECEAVWAPEGPAPSSGTLHAADDGRLGHLGAAVGVHYIPYRVMFGRPGAVAPTSDQYTITHSVSSGDVEPPVMVGEVGLSGLTSTGYTMTVQAATDNIGVVGYEFSIDNGASWSDNGASRTAVVTGRTPGSTDNVQWRAYDGAGNRATPITRAIQLLEIVEPTFPTQPASQSITDGAQAVIAWAVAGTAPIAQQVQMRASPSDSWADVSGATSSPYTSPALSVAASGRQYRVRATGPSTVPVYSDTVTVTVSAVSVSPELSGASAFAASATTAIGQVTANKVGGTLFWVASLTEPDAPQIKAGQSQAVAILGIQPVSVGGLDPATPGYRLHFVWTDGDGQDSAVQRSNTFSTPALPVPGAQGRRLPITRNDYFDLLQRIAVSQA